MTRHSCLVTGGAGFIGSHVAQALLSAGHEVTVLDDLSGGFAHNVPDGAELVVGQVQDEAVVRRLFAEHSFTRVYHLAAYAAEGLSHFIRQFNYENNVLGSMVLINAALRSGQVECFLFASSIAVYGAGQVPMTEHLTPAPEDPYGVAKYAVELDLAAAAHMFGLPYVIVRPHNVYGERQHIGDRYRNVVGIFCNQALRGEPFTVFGDGEQQRAFSYIDDVAPVIAGAPDVPAALGEVFNIGGDQVTTVNDLAATVALAMGVDLRMAHLPARKEVVLAFSNHDKAREILGAKARVDLVEGVSRMAAWARTRGPMSPTEFSGIEVTRHLPPSWLPVTS